jgi:hypothetical protein
MTSSVLDRPVDLPLDDFSVACALHEVTAGKPVCDREATLAIHLHQCRSTVSCQECWTSLVKYMKDKQKELDAHVDAVGQAIGGWACGICQKRAKTFDDLMWAEPL